MLRIVATLIALTAATVLGQTTFYPSPMPPQPIPDAFSPGVCTLPAFMSVTVTAPGTVADVNAVVGLTHPYSGNLRIRLIKGSTSVVLADTIPYDASPLSGTYVFDDEAPVTFDAAMLAAPGATPVAPGPYRGDGLLSAFDGLSLAGDWFIEVCDLAPGFTGLIAGFGVAITAGGNGLTFTITQTLIPSPPAPPGLTHIQMLAVGAIQPVPLNWCLKAITANQGNFPNGWFFGIDIGWLDLLGQYGAGWPFFQSMNIGGEALSYVDGVPVGIGVPVYAVAVELDATTFMPLHWSAPISILLM